MSFRATCNGCGESYRLGTTDRIHEPAPSYPERWFVLGGPAISEVEWPAACSIGCLVTLAERALAELDAVKPPA